MFNHSHAKRTFQLFRDSKDCPSLQQCRTAAGPPSFIRLELRNTAGFRSRLRFNVANTKQQQYKRQLCASPDCPTCPGTIDSIEHIFLHCPRFAAARYQCETALAALLLPLNMLTLLSTDDTAN